MESVSRACVVRQEHGKYWSGTTLELLRDSDLFSWSLGDRGAAGEGCTGALTLKIN